MSTPETNSRITVDFLYNYFRDCLIGIRRVENPGTTFKNINWQPVCTGNDGKLFEVNESRTYNKNDCDAY